VKILNVNADVLDKISPYNQIEVINITLSEKSLYQLKYLVLSGLCHFKEITLNDSPKIDLKDLSFDFLKKIDKIFLITSREETIRKFFDYKYHLRILPIFKVSKSFLSELLSCDFECLSIAEPFRKFRKDIKIDPGALLSTRVRHIILPQNFINNKLIIKRSLFTNPFNVATLMGNKLVRGSKYGDYVRIIHNWRRVCILISNERSNKDNALKNSIFPLCGEIIKYLPKYIVPLSNEWDPISTFDI